DYCNLPLYMKSDPFFRKQSEHHDPCPVVPPREASIRGLAQRAYHSQGRHVTMDSAKQQALTMGHSGLSNLTSSGAGNPWRCLFFLFQNGRIQRLSPGEQLIGIRQTTEAEGWGVRSLLQVLHTCVACHYRGLSL
ncbi:hypothetical protein GOODEAATRI_015193, partial [Goodea atripinnis]